VISPGELAARLESLPLAVDGLAVELGSVALAGYYDDASRPTGIALLAGGGEEGRGECVAWTPEEQGAFRAACGRLAPPSRTTVGELSRLLGDELDDPYHRAAVEGAAIDLALRHAATNPFALAGRPASPVGFCWSLGRQGDPLAAVEAFLARAPEARLKVDVPAAGWSEAEWARLAATGRVVVVDFKRDAEPAQVALAHGFLPDAWLEDPPPAVITTDPGGGWRRRVALDGYVLAAVDLEAPEIPPAAVNVKAPRVGGWLEALRCLEVCRRRDLGAYVGGMFEVDVGRRQARVLASLFTAAAWNDLAPPAPAAGETPPASPLALADDFVGFAPDPG